MKTVDFNFSYPDELVATQPSRPTRVMYCDSSTGPQELKLEELLEKISPNDLVVINDTKVEKRRVFTDDGLEILFLEQLQPKTWSVLMPAKKIKIGQHIQLPGEISAELIEKGLPQTLLLNCEFDDNYFDRQGHMALPPYIQKARGLRKSQDTDDSWYQTEWANEAGSSAAPTASLHFTNQHWEVLKQRGVQVKHLTLHVGLGTFLPVHSELLVEHKMHSEVVEIPADTLWAIQTTQKNGGKVWALGTTVTRALESVPKKYFQSNESGGLVGSTDIFIYPGFEFQVVDVLMTNFHQPQSTLLALVSAFAGFDKTLQAYQWAVEKRFRLFSYGDLSVWTR